MICFRKDVRELPLPTTPRPETLHPKKSKKTDQISKVYDHLNDLGDNILELSKIVNSNMSTILDLQKQINQRKPVRQKGILERVACFLFGDGE